MNGTHSSCVFIEPNGPDAVQLLQVDVALPPEADAVEDQRRVDVNLERWSML